MTGGVRLGATTPYQPINSNPGSVSATAGTSGTTFERVSEVMPITRTLFARASGSAEVMLATINCSCPAATSAIAADGPLYGTWFSLMPATEAKISVTT